MDWLEQIKRDLEKSKEHPIRKKKDWQIDRDIRLNNQSKKAALAASKVVTAAKTYAQKNNGKKNKGIKRTNEFREVVSEKLKGRVVTEEHRNKISSSLKGKAKSEEHKQHLSESKKGIKCQHTSNRNSEFNSMKFKCNNCQREIGGLANYKRFHGDNCKHKN
jgi:hypothetical protein